MRRSTTSSLRSVVMSLATPGVYRVNHRFMWLAVALVLGLGVLSGTVGSAAASGGLATQTSPAALVQGDGYEMRTYVANCQIVPPLPPTLNEAGCAPAVGAYVEFVADDGTTLGACTANVVTSDGQSAGCSVIVPFSTSGQAYLVTSTIDGAFAPQRNPISFNSPDPGPIDGIVGFPIFVNLPTGGSGQAGQTGETDQTLPVQQPQQAGTGRPLRLHHHRDLRRPRGDARRPDRCLHPAG